jgi:hypothetical protein
MNNAEKGRLLHSMFLKVSFKQWFEEQYKEELTQSTVEFEFT